MFVKDIRLNVFNSFLVLFMLLTRKNFLPLKRQPHKMVKHTQTIRWLLPTNCLSVFDHFVELALKGLKGAIHFSPCQTYWK